MSNYRTPALDGRFACARCGDRHEASSGTYSPEGELLCRACIARDVVAGSSASEAPDSPGRVLEPNPHPLRDLLLGVVAGAFLAVMFGAVFFGLVASFEGAFFVCPLGALVAGAITTALRRPGRRAFWALGLFGGAILLAAAVMFLVVAALGSHG
jgi:hypothetical protein